MSDAYDVVVVGSGAGGGTLAWSLAEAGARVLVLEKGPFYGLKDFQHHDELAVTRGGMFQPLPTEEPHLVLEEGATEARRTDDGWIANCVGGGTVHMSGFFLRFHPDDLKQKSVLGAPSGSTVQDWPISYDELEPWYERAEYLLGVGGDHTKNPFEPPRRKPFPLPPPDEHPLVHKLDAASRKLGWHAYPTPRAVLSRPYGGRAPCNYCGYCGNYGCETGAKSSVLSVFIPWALATGRCEIRAKCMATELVMGEDGKARGVRYLDEQGAQHEVNGRVVVVSCSTIESARLLLNSKSARFPDGVGNAEGQVGRNLTFSSFASVLAQIDRSGGAKDVPDLFSKKPWLGRSVQDFYRPAGLRKGGTLRFDLAPPNPIANAQMASMSAEPPLFGLRLKEAMRHHFRESRMLAAEIFSEFVPTPGTHVTVDGSVRDRFGLPVAKITLAHHPEDGQATKLLAARAVELFEAMGCERTWVRTELGTTWVLQHGALRFGVDPKESVLDKDCRVHAVPNLYVVDGGFMPTSGSVPSTLTIQANALRVAAHLSERLLKREL